MVPKPPRKAGHAKPAIRKAREVGKGKEAKKGAVKKTQARKTSPSKPTTKVTADAKRQRNRRDRMKREGMTLPRIWMFPDEVTFVKDQLRRYRLRKTYQLIEKMEFKPMNQKWTIQTLFDQLTKHSDEHAHCFGLALKGGDHPAIEVTHKDHGDLPIHIVVLDHEIRVQSVLCDRADVKDPARFNEHCLVLGPTLPLSNLGLLDDHYVVYGQLSTHSPFPNVVEEIETLGRNAIDVARDLRFHNH